MGDVSLGSHNSSIYKGLSAAVTKGQVKCVKVGSWVHVPKFPVKSFLYTWRRDLIRMYSWGTSAVISSPSERGTLSAWWNLGSLTPCNVILEAGYFEKHTVQAHLSLLDMLPQVKHILSPPQFLLSCGKQCTALLIGNLLFSPWWLTEKI